MKAKPNSQNSNSTKANSVQWIGTRTRDSKAGKQNETSEYPTRQPASEPTSNPSIHPTEPMYRKAQFIVSTIFISQTFEL